MSEDTSVGSVTKNLDIQVIRGIAVILVFLHHVRGHLPEFAAYSAFAVSLLVADLSYRTVEWFGNKR